MWLSNFYNTGLNRNNFFKQWLFCINKIFETKALSSGQCDALWRCSSLRTRLCSPSHMPGLLELWTATPQVFRLSAPSKAGLPKALLNTEGSVGVDVNELYFKYQRLLNKENGCFSINLSVFIVNSWPCYSESVGRHSCISVLWERFPKSVSGHSQTHCSWNLEHLSVELHVFMQLQWCIKQTRGALTDSSQKIHYHPIPDTKAFHNFDCLRPNGLYICTISSATFFLEIWF